MLIGDVNTYYYLPEKYQEFIKEQNLSIVERGKILLQDLWIKK